VEMKLAQARFRPVENIVEKASGSLGTVARKAFLPVLRIRSTV